MEFFPNLRRIEVAEVGLDSSGQNKDSRKYGSEYDPILFDTTANPLKTKGDIGSLSYGADIQLNQADRDKMTKNTRSLPTFDDVLNGNN